MSPLELDLFMTVRACLWLVEKAILLMVCMMLLLAGKAMCRLPILRKDAIVILFLG